MTPEMNCSNVETDHVKPFCFSDVSKNDGKKEAFNGMISQLSLKKKNRHQET